MRMSRDQTNLLLVSMKFSVLTFIIVSFFNFDAKCYHKEAI